ncbi:MAG: Indolepyruvate oxidoreductase subunit IorB [Promethearchaeota archaeon]|nr:MAG: Indolepyruvate oxidoreductase subunit IorB [Candidatus Lokiarchaeota archaeon]
MIYSIITCGVGGQGLMLVSNIIGIACAEYEYNIRTAETHGLAQRSGSIYTHIRMSETEQIYSPLIPYGEADVMLAMEAIEALRNIEFLKSEGLIVLNDYIWHPVQETFNRVKEPKQTYITIDEIIQKLHEITNTIFKIDALKIANEAGNALASNVALLGFLANTENFPFTLDQLKPIVSQVVPKKAVDINIKALELGYNATSTG